MLCGLDALRIFLAKFEQLDKERRIKGTCQEIYIYVVIEAILQVYGMFLS